MWYSKGIVCVSVCGVVYKQQSLAHRNCLIMKCLAMAFCCSSQVTSREAAKDMTRNTAAHIHADTDRQTDR